MSNIENIVDCQNPGYSGTMRILSNMVGADKSTLLIEQMSTRPKLDVNLNAVSLTSLGSLSADLTICS